MPFILIGSGTCPLNLPRKCHPHICPSEQAAQTEKVLGYTGSHGRDVLDSFPSPTVHLAITVEMF